MIYKVKRFSLTDKLKSAGRSAIKGAGAGALFTPGNLILALCGKKKASLILTGVGAGIGAGIGFYLGWIGSGDHKKDPEELQKYLNSLPSQPKDDIWEESDFKKSGISYRPDFYRYLKLYRAFSKKYYQEWNDAWKNLEDKTEIDMEFGIVFPTPYLDDNSDEEGYIAANGLSPSDHYWIMWDASKEVYTGSCKTLLEASQKFASEWIVDERKIKDPKILKVAEIHNKIIREFLKLR